jgi:Capsule assembly protein Wzi
MRFLRRSLPLVVSAIGFAASLLAGPVYVPLDSWVYPALHRLAALGIVKSQPADFGPWTRAECARQVKEAEAAVTEEPREDAARLLTALKAEFEESAPGTQLRLESLYTRAIGIGGTPLRDSYHFGQTIANDLGRPYDSGFNSVAGFSGYGSAGRFSAYLRGEFQQAPGRAAPRQSLQDFLSRTDGNPLQPASPSASTTRFEPLEMYVGVQLGFENITVGKQALWWGPGEESAFAFSDNAAPFYMLRFEQQRPFELPGRFAKVRTEILVGQLSGHHWPARPYINAQKIALDLPGNLELGFTRSAIFGGEGRPLTLHTFGQSLFGVNSVDFGPYGSYDPPGDRHSGFDFQWRLPGVRHLVTIYSDSYADDDPNPLDNPKRSAWAPGIYFPRVPGVPGLDLRFETYSTWLYRKDQGGNFLYYNSQYHDSYTNSGNLLGSWVGRDSRAYVGTSTYWLSAKTKIQARYKQIKAGNAFLPGGGTQTDVSLVAQWAPTREWMLDAQIQGERYFVPILGGHRHDVVAGLGLSFTPARFSWGTPTNSRN